MPGFYPDPSIPGYIRYWDGAIWVPGTSRPEPREGEPMPQPPDPAAAGGGAAGGRGPGPQASAGQQPLEGRVVRSGHSGGADETASPSASAPMPDEATGPHFFDEDDLIADAVPGSASGEPEDALPELRPRGEAARNDPMVSDWDDPRRLHGNRPESAAGWHADAAQQAGYDGGSGSGMAWGEPEPKPEPLSGAEEYGDGSGADARTAPAADPRGSWGRTDEGGGADAADQGAGSGSVPAAGAAGTGGTPRTADSQPHGPQGPQGPQGQQAGGQPESQTPPGGGPTDTVGIRIPRPSEGGRGRGSGGAQQQPEHTVGLRRSDVLGAAGAVPRQGSPQGTPPAAPAPGPAAGTPAAYGAQPGAPAQEAGPAHPAQGPVQGAAPVQDAARPPWAQQVHDLAQQPGGGLPAQPQSGGPDAVAPWRPPPSDPFLQSAQQQARPAGLGKRFGARLVDGILVFGLTGAVAFPLVGKADDHIQGKIDAAEQAGVTREVWLIDGTTGGYLAIVLGVLLLFGLLYEALPTARWGRTLGKKLFGLTVLDVERQDPPRAGAAVLRWLTYGVLAVLVIGVVNVLWCVFDRPWRQCWHDKAARTFVAGA